MNARGLPGLEPESRRPHNVLQVGTRANAASAARFLDAIVERMPFPVKAI